MLNMRETIPEVFRAMEKQVYKDICKYDGCFPKIEYAENLKDEVLENALHGYSNLCSRAKWEKGYSVQYRGNVQQLDN